MQYTWDVKLVTTDKRRNQLGSEPNFRTIKFFEKCDSNRNEEVKSKN